jgi:hypothetical protein
MSGTSKQSLLKEIIEFVNRECSCGELWSKDELVTEIQQKIIMKYGLQKGSAVRCELQSTGKISVTINDKWNPFSNFQ